MGSHAAEVELVYAYVGAWLQKSRQDRGMSRDELAALLDLSRASITNIEQGRHRVPLYIYLRMCRVLGIDPGGPLDAAAHDEKNEELY